MEAHETGWIMASFCYAIEPDGASATALFLNVLKPSVDSGEKSPEAIPVEDAGRFGTEFEYGGRSYRILFSKETLDAPAITVR